MLRCLMEKSRALTDTTSLPGRHLNLSYKRLPTKTVFVAAGFVTVSEKNKDFLFELVAIYAGVSFDAITGQRGLRAV